MPINVVFDKNGFYHPVFGRMGRGRNQGKVYTLPDAFDKNGMLPSTAELIDDPDDLEETLELEGQRKPIKPKVLDEGRAEKITGAGRRKKASSAAERTTGEDEAPKPKRQRKKPAARKDA